MIEQQYKLRTALSLVVGIVIGSGIFFKADDVLSAVNGNVKLGILGFLIVGIGVLFGALVIAHYAEDDEEQSGMIGYAKRAMGSRFGYIVGWFTITIYFPALVVILSFVTMIYLSILLGIDSYAFTAIGAAVVLIGTYIVNIKSPGAGGKIQVLLTVAKMLPLFLIGIVGMTMFASGNSNVATDIAPVTGGKPITALIAIAFSFDGWIVATSIGNELEDSHKNLPRALVGGLIAVIAIYCLYFFGITQIVAPNEIVSLGDAHTNLAASRILGPVGGQIITAFVVLSVYGGVNGMVLAYLRMPKLFAESGLMKDIFHAETESEVTTKSIKFGLCWIIFYFLFQVLVDTGVIFSNLESAFDISSLPITVNYIFYFFVFIAVNRLVVDKPTKTRIYYAVVSFIACVTALFVVYGALQANGLLYIGFSALVIIAGLPLYKRN